MLQIKIFRHWIIIGLFYLVPVISLFFGINNKARADLLFNNASRIIYFSQEKQHHFDVIHHADHQLLVQSWITTLEGVDDVPFVISPSLKKLDANVPLSLDIMLLSEASLPSDRESVFYFYLNEVPSRTMLSVDNNPEQKQSEITFAIKHRFYLFYRPLNIGINSMENVYSLTWHFSKNKQGDLVLIADNPYPFYYSLTDLELSDTQSKENQSFAEHALLAPLTATEIPIPKNITVNTNNALLKFNVITDIGRGLPIVVKNINSFSNNE